MQVLEFLEGTSLPAMLIRLVLAAIAGSLVGIERGRSGRPAGMRTYSLVCLGAALAVQIGMISMQRLAPGSDPMRIAAQVISGIGFLGVGTILIKGRFQITGLTTAAGLWVTGALGLAIGIGYLVGAFVGIVLILLIITVVAYIEKHINRHHMRLSLYIEIESAEHVRPIFLALQEKYAAEDIEVVPSRTNLTGHVGLEASIHTYFAKKQHTPEELIAEIEEIDGTAFVLESI